jgi:L-fuculose-phosphate aldolase
LKNTELSQEILEIGRRLHTKNLLAAADGNISCRISENEILITPSGINKAFLKPDQLAVITIDNKILSGSPSSERLMHLEVYRNCPHAKCVIHAHPPTAVAWSVAHPNLKELPSECLSEIILAVGKIPIAPYACPSTQQMGDRIRPYLPDCKVIVLARHGALTWGESPQEAYNGMERLEHSAQILMYAHMLGGLTSLAKEELDALRTIRAKPGGNTL